MRRLSSIFVTLTTLVLLFYGAGGISMERCACSGETSLLSLNDGMCCASESGCMTVTSVSLSDSALPNHVSLPQLQSLPVEILVFKPFVTSSNTESCGRILSAGYSPPPYTLTTVLRV